MDPILSWVMAGLSAFLLVTGGFILARALGAGRLRQLVERERRIGEQLSQSIAEREELRDALSRVPAAEPDRPPPRRDAPVDQFGEATALPDPRGYFDARAERPSAPGLDMISEDEYELQADIPPSEVEPDNEGFECDPKDATRQFKLHSPEAVVHFLDRIDELSDENRALKTALADRDLQIQEHRVEDGEHVQRFAALDATTSVLREELKRRNTRIKQLEEQLEGELRTGVPARPEQHRRGGPPPIPQHAPSEIQDAWPGAPPAPEVLNPDGPRGRDPKS